jgi:hypothetical protein
MGVVLLVDELQAKNPKSDAVTTTAERNVRATCMVGPRNSVWQLSETAGLPGHHRNSLVAVV